MFKKFTQNELYDIFVKHVQKDESYFTKNNNVISKLTSDGKSFWKNKDVPRLFSILDFKEWVKKYNIVEGEKLFYTDNSDIELNFIKYKNKKLFLYDGFNHDLHNINHNEKDFDFILFNQTIEHLYNPFICMQNLFNHLKSGGYLYTTAPTINIPHMTPIHFWGVTPMGLCVLGKSVGLEIMECGYWGNNKYIDYIFKNNNWPDYTQVCDSNNLIDNNFVNQSQTWALFKKP
jgi:SAM-dependent methyltransferase